MALANRGNLLPNPRKKGKKRAARLLEERIERMKRKKCCAAGAKDATAKALPFHSAKVRKKKFRQRKADKRKKRDKISRRIPGREKNTADPSLRKGKALLLPQKRGKKKSLLQPS